MRSIVLRNGYTPGHVSIAIRTHDMGGVDYEVVAVLEKKDAAAIAGNHTGLYFQFDKPELHEGVEKHPLVIERVPDREPGERAWRMRIGGELAMRVDRVDGIRKELRLGDGAVKELIEHARVEFADGPPDWGLRHVEDLEDRAIEMERKAAEVREKATAARAHWEARQASSREPA